MTKFIEQKRTGAIFSPCRQYRYSLWRIWDFGKPLCNFIGLNPSTADETQDDPTIRRCIRYCRDWGYGGYVMTNLFAYRATEPKVMKRWHEPVGADNDRALSEVADACHLVVAAWGVHGVHRDRSDDVRKKLPVCLHCLGLTKGGHPKHPLYLKASQKPVIYKRPLWVLK